MIGLAVIFIMLHVPVSVTAMPTFIADFRMGILPEVASGLEAAVELTRPPQD